jgi:hypothetical protein
MVLFSYSQPFQRNVNHANVRPPLSEKGLFESDEVLNITLRGDIRKLLADRSDNMAFHPVMLSYHKEDNSEIFLRVDMKTRGHFRRLKENCTYPPLLIQFHKSDTLSSSIFYEQGKMKLVMPCSGDEYIIREWLVYKIYNMITPKSFRARLVRVSLEDLENKKEIPAFYGILLEEEMQMASRNKLISVERKLIPEQVAPLEFLEMAVFQYLIGNTDWSVQYLQNIKLLAADSLALPTAVPYDFDHAGIVNAPYAKPAEELVMSSVRERRYRGYCMKDLKEFDGVIAHYLNLKNDIYSLYANCPLLDEKYKKQVENYLDGFYKTLSNGKSWQKAFSYPCYKNGTGNVVISGLKDQ